MFSIDPSDDRFPRVLLLDAGVVVGVVFVAFCGCSVVSLTSLGSSFVVSFNARGSVLRIESSFSSFSFATALESGDCGDLVFLGD